MSRLIVKNLPNSVTVDKLKQKFGEKGFVTDVQLKYTKDGRFRHFAFVGYRTEEDARKSQIYFDNTYFGACKIFVELSSGPGDPNKPRAWSKYSCDSSRYQHINGVPINTVVRNERDASSGGKNKEEKELYQKYKDDPQFAEFMLVHRKDKGSIWGNDILVNTEKKQQMLKEDNIQLGKGDLQNGMDLENINSRCSESGSKASDANISSKSDSTKKWKEYFTVKIRGLSAKTNKKSLKEFFKPMVPKSIRRPKSIKEIAYIGFTLEQEMKKALLKNKSFLDGHQVIVSVYSKHSSDVDKYDEELHKLEESVADTGRLFIRNLTYSVAEDDLRSLFESYGPIAEVHVPIDRHTRKVKGFAFVAFMMPEHAVRAFSELDGSVFQGRLLHIIPGQARKSYEELLEKEGINFKTKKFLKQKTHAKSSHNWNTLFLGTSAVADVMAQRYNTSKQEVLSSDGKHSVAVRLALGETQLVKETKTFLQENGVYLDVFSKPASERSKTVIIVKDLPANTAATELGEIFSKHGEVGRVILPPHGITALVEFLEPSEARKAFEKLSYTRFYHLPLYLEWAPIGIFQKTKVTQEGKAATEETSDTKDVKTIEAEKEEGFYEECEADTTLFVKNLSFKTTDAQLREHFESCGKLYTVSIAHKKDMKNPTKLLSMGYGFVQFKQKKAAQEAMKSLQHSILDDHALELKVSNRTTQKDVKTVHKKTKVGKQTGTKILVRNIAFQATKQELMELFKPFGTTKAVRLPQKMAGTGSHRGFCFIDYYTKSDAKNAFEALCQSTHLYGRRLVLEWAQAEDTVDDLRRKTASRFHDDESINAKKQKLEEMVSDIVQDV